MVEAKRLGLALSAAIAALMVVVVATFWSGQQRGDTHRGPIPPMKAAGQLTTYDDYAQVLETYVDEDGLVDYQSLKENRRQLDRFIAGLATFDPSICQRWTDRDWLAFWTNVYNAITLRSIIDNYPIRPSLFRNVFWPGNSVRQIDGVWDGVRWVVMGESLTLDDIAHRIIRGRYNEPRVHAALVFAADSSPPLRNEPYRGQELEKQLDDQMRRFLASDAGFRINRSRDIVYLSRIFLWYSQDFTKAYDADERFAGFSEEERVVLQLILPYLDEEDQQYLLENDFSLRYLYYDWSLNERSAVAEEA